MQKIHTKLQMNQQHLPNQIDFLQVIWRRGSTNFSEEKQRYKSLLAGDIGEEKLLQYLLDFGRPHWVTLKNIWLKDFTLFECDFILFTHHCIYIFEVKNYQGTFAFRKNKCFFNEVETPLNPFEQVRANTASLRNYLKRFNIEIPVKSAVIFTGTDHEVIIDSPIDGIEIVPSNGIRNFIKKVIVDERRSSPHSVAFESIIKILAKIETTNPYLPHPLKTKGLSEIKKGIYCRNCESFDYERSKMKIHCVCGKEEKIEQAALRTIRDYRILNYDRPISRVELMHFFNGEISLSLLRKILTKYFDKIEQIGPAYYNIPIKKITELIE